MAEGNWALAPFGKSLTRQIARRRGVVIAEHPDGLQPFQQAQQRGAICG